MSKEIDNKQDYNELFKAKQPKEESSKMSPEYMRLEKILDIRKFEIELYWKRATYFWTFIAAAFTAYGLVLNSSNNSEQLTEFKFLIICLGIVFSFAWFLANKASKYWQENWEKHLDLTEDDVIGPLYKTVINKNTYSSFWPPTKAYAVSVSKINQILSMFVFLIWIALFVNFLKHYLDFKCVDLYYSLIGSITVIIIILLLTVTRTSNKNTEVHFELREVVDKRTIPHS